MGAVASQITSLTIVCWTVYSDADQRKHQSSASLAFVRGIHRGLVNSPHKWPVTRKMFPFDDVIMVFGSALSVYISCRVELVCVYFEFTLLSSTWWTQNGHKLAHREHTKFPEHTLAQSCWGVFYHTWGGRSIIIRTCGLLRKFFIQRDILQDSWKKKCQYLIVVNRIPWQW